MADSNQRRVPAMKHPAALAFGFVIAVAVSVSAIPLQAQSFIPGAAGTEMVRNLRPSGQPVIPLFDGWYPNPDGSHGLCFGYFNLNLEEVLDIPLGPDNFIEPAEYDGMQPTNFLPVPSRLDGLDRRYYCTFSATIPPGSENERVVWTLRHDGETYSVPAHIGADDYKIESPDQPGRNSVSPWVQFLDPSGPAGRGRDGDIIAGPVDVEAGMPLDLRISVVEPDTDNPNSGFERVLTIWTKHQGPGDVRFGSYEQTPVSGGVEAITTARFSAAGDYMLRLQAFEGGNPWGAQCCWTNAYVRVTVRP